MKIHEKIYIQYFDEDGEENEGEDILWCCDRIYDGDIEYALAKPQIMDTAPIIGLILLFEEVWKVGYLDKYTNKWVLNSMENEELNPTHWLPLPPKPEINEP